MTLSRLGICAGMVSGMSLAVEALTAALCLPDLITVEEQVRVVVEFLKALRSDQLQEPSMDAALVLFALQDAFPCQ